MKFSDYEKIERDSMAALNDPKPGDRWHEMYSWWMYVLKVEDGKVTTISSGAPCEFPKDGKIEVRTWAEFVQWLTYKSIPNKTWATLADRGNDISWAGI